LCREIRGIFRMGKQSEEVGAALCAGRYVEHFIWANSQKRSVAGSRRSTEVRSSTRRRRRERKELHSIW